VTTTAEQTTVLFDGTDYELVVGLEVHTELATATKLFSPSPNRFGDEPNTNIDPVTLGLPGALPVLNRHAVELAMRIGLALNCTIQACSFHRKNYFYPDMPKAYQISQYDVPLNVDGWLDPRTARASASSGRTSRRTPGSRPTSAVPAAGSTAVTRR
jgi:aspartyl-tRNA(Asn)/glutamyl-tRNA(Gln) amidotransferase subunit B